jgi:hypothetical protein
MVLADRCTAPLDGLREQRNSAKDEAKENRSLLALSSLHCLCVNEVLESSKGNLAASKQSAYFNGGRCESTKSSTSARNLTVWKKLRPE